jgi:hypothetical protein
MRGIKSGRLAAERKRLTPVKLKPVLNEAQHTPFNAVRTQTQCCDEEISKHFVN